MYKPDSSLTHENDYFMQKNNTYNINEHHSTQFELEQNCYI